MGEGFTKMTVMITERQIERLAEAIEEAKPLLATGEYRAVTIPDDVSALTKDEAEATIGDLRDLVPVGYDYRDKTGELWTVTDYTEAARDGHDGPESLGL